MGSSQAWTGQASGRQHRLLILFAVVPYLLGVLNGNLFALHVGLTAAPSPTAPASVAEQAPASTAPGPPQDAKQRTTAWGPASLSDTSVHMGPPASSASQERPAQGPLSPRGMHLLHLLGACMAVLLAAIALLFTRFEAARAAADGLLTRPASAGVIPSVTRFAWRPPPLWPPTSSPVIRQ